MKPKPYIILFICLICLKCEKTENYYLPQILKDWGYYKEGSYWIYQNQSTGELDSIYVSSTKEYIDKNEADKRITSASEAIGINYSNNRKYSYKVTLYAYTISSIFVNQYDSLNDIRSDYKLFHVNSKNEICDHVPYYIIVEKSSEMSVNGTIYYDVLHISTFVENEYFSTQYSQDKSYHDYWISKHNWIIKKTVRNAKYEQEWFLIRSNIIQ